MPFFWAADGTIFISLIRKGGIIKRVVGAVYVHETELGRGVTQVSVCIE
jgi:hypothetical protein